MIDHRDYGIDEHDAYEVDKLAESQLEYAYHLKLRADNIELARAHAVILLYDKPKKLDALTKEDYDKMAEMFENSKDPNRTDNQIWNEVVWDYIEESEAAT